MAPAAHMLMSPYRVPKRHLVGRGGENSSAGCCPRMPDYDRTSIDVDLIPVHWIGGRALPALLPCRGVCQHLGGERFVDLDPINVLQSQADAVEQSRHGDGGGCEQPLVRGSRGAAYSMASTKAKGDPASCRRAFLAHEQHGRCPVCDGRRIAGGDRSPSASNAGLSVAGRSSEGIGPRAPLQGDAIKRQDLLPRGERAPPPRYDDSPGRISSWLAFRNAPLLACVISVC